jgi:hypothetical protein
VYVEFKEKLVENWHDDGLEVCNALEILKLSIKMINILKCKECMKHNL